MKFVIIVLKQLVLTLADKGFFTIQEINDMFDNLDEAEAQLREEENKND
jgi:hypothetical protein